MAFEQKLNSGALFPPKEEKGPDDKRPDASGPLLVECPCCKAHIKFELSAWTKLPKSGGKRFMSISAKVAKGGVTPAKRTTDAAAGEEPGKPPEERVAF